MRSLSSWRTLVAGLFFWVWTSACGGPAAKPADDGVDPFQRFKEPVAEAAPDPLAGDPARAAFKPLCLSLRPLAPERVAQAPVAVHREQPEMAANAKVKGAVVVEVIVDAQGLVCDARLVSGVGGRLDQSSVEAAKLWTFRAARKRGEATPCFHKVSFAFDLK